MSVGEFFGFNEFITNRPVKYKVISKEYVTICKIKRDDFLKVLVNH